MDSSVVQPSMQGPGAVLKTLLSEQLPGSSYPSVCTDGLKDTGCRNASQSLQLDLLVAGVPVAHWLNTIMLVCLGLCRPYIVLQYNRHNSYPLMKGLLYLWKVKPALDGR